MNIMTKTRAMSLLVATAIMTVSPLVASAQTAVVNRTGPAGNSVTTVRNISPYYGARYGARTSGCCSAAAGVAAGLVAGAVISAAVAPRPTVVYAAAPVVTYAPPVVYAPPPGAYYYVQ